MGENLIVLVKGKYPLSPQVKNKWYVTFFNVLNAKPQNVWSPSVGVHWRLLLVCTQVQLTSLPDQISFIELYYELYR